MKTCGTCKKELELSAFGIRRKASDGLSTMCKSCNCANAKRYREKYPERKRASDANWLANNKDVKAKGDKEYRRKNKDRLKVTRKAYVDKNKERLAKYAKDYQCKNREKIAANKAAYWVKTKDIRLAYLKEWYSNNREWVAEYRAKNKDEMTRKRKLNAPAKRETSKVWRAANKDAIAERAKEYKSRPETKVKTARDMAKRRAKKLQRTPKWLTEDDYRFIDLFYKEARRLTDETGVPHHVDHIVPLQGEKVSGLHCPLNLQVLTQYENCSKHNKFNVLTQGGEK